MSEPRPLATSALIGLYNLAQNLLVPGWAYVPANLAAGWGLLAMARRQGCTREDLGLSPSQARSGLRLGLAGSAGAALVAMLAAAHPRTRIYLLDQRAARQRDIEVLFRSVVRFPLGTSLFEEVAFRGVSHAVWRRSGASPRRAALATATAFALWHLIPASQALTGSPLAERVPRRSRTGVVLVGATLTGLAGLGLTWMRERSGSLLAPWMTHAAVNTAGYLAAVMAWRRAALPVKG